MTQGHPGTFSTRAAMVWTLWQLLVGNAQASKVVVTTGGTTAEPPPASHAGPPHCSCTTLNNHALKTATNSNPRGRAKGRTHGGHTSQNPDAAVRWGLTGTWTCFTH